jgi:hypothetical protein
MTSRVVVDTRRAFPGGQRWILIQVGLIGLLGGPEEGVLCEGYFMGRIDLSVTIQQLPDRMFQGRQLSFSFEGGMYREPRKVAWDGIVTRLPLGRGDIPGSRDRHRPPDIQCRSGRGFIDYGEWEVGDRSTVPRVGGVGICWA